jgi:6-phosphogluconate dehydrogenase
MELGLIGLGRMGINMARRLLHAQHQVVGFDVDTHAVQGLVQYGAEGVASLEIMTRRLVPPRTLWLMVPAGRVDSLLEELVPLLEPGDTVIDGGNSFYRDDQRRSKELATKGIEYMDVGTSGGIFGLERGYCLMIGGTQNAYARLEPIFAALAPGAKAAGRTPARTGQEPTSAEMGYLLCGSSGAGHFVKMVHNGIEYGLMSAYAEGFNILRHADVGTRPLVATDAETSPLRDPEAYRYTLPVSEIAELWRRGSVISSWLLDLAADALVRDGELQSFHGRVSDSGEGRWTIEAAIESGTPAPTLATALFARFDSRGESDFARRLLSALRSEFGGHAEKPGVFP